MSADIQGRQTTHKAALLETRAGKRSSCLHGKAEIYSPPLSKIPAVRACREMANSYTGHWVSVQGLMGPQISYVGRCVPKNTLRNM